MEAISIFDKCIGLGPATVIEIIYFDKLFLYHDSMHTSCVAIGMHASWVAETYFFLPVYASPRLAHRTSRNTEIERET